jgi:hypothetical protein
MATGRRSVRARGAGIASVPGFGLRGFGRMRLGLRPSEHAETREIALHLGRHFHARRFLAALIACAAALTALDLLQAHGFGYSLRLFDLTDSDVRSKLSFSATLTCGLLVSAAWLSFALERVDPRRDRARWNVAGTVFCLFAVEELFGFQHGAEATFDLSDTVYLVVAAAAAVAWLGPLYTLRTRRPLQLVFGLAMVGWLGAWLIDAVRSSGSGEPAGAELVEFLAAGLFCAALLGRLQYLSRRLDPLGQADAPEISRAIAQLVSRIDLERVMIAVGVLIAGFAAQDVLLHTGNYHGHRIPVLDVNTEQTIPATFSALLLVAAGGLAVLAGGMRAMRVSDRTWWKWLGVVFLALALEEVAAIHDTFQDLIGLPGQIVLLPLAVAGVIAWWQVVGRTVDRPAVRALLIAGAAAWLASQISDLVLNPVVRWTIVPEEALEMTGSALWLLATALLVRALLAESPQPDEVISAAPLNAAPRAGYVLGTVPDDPP